MICTEEEARKISCPHWVLISVVEKWVKGEPTCQGSQCMMWRWWDRDGEGPVSEQWIQDGGPPIKLRRGYCGLAGRPEWE